MTLNQSFSSRLLQLFGMKFPCNIDIAWKQLCKISLTVTGLLVVLWCSGEGTSSRFSEWLRKEVGRILYMHVSNTHNYSSMCRSSIWLKNMQLGQGPEEQAYAQWLLSISERTNQQHGGVEYTMPLPDHVNIGGRTAEGGLESLHATYPDISDL